MLSSFQGTDFPDSFNPLPVHASEFRGFRDGEIRRRAKCAHGRHGGVGHARCIDCSGSADVSRGNRRPCGRESERQRAGGRICCSRSLPGASGAGQRIADSTGPPAYVTRGCVLGEGPWLDESGPSTTSSFSAPGSRCVAAQVRRRIREGAGPALDPPRSIVAIGRVGWII